MRHEIPPCRRGCEKTKPENLKHGATKPQPKPLTAESAAGAEIRRKSKGKSSNFKFKILRLDFRPPFPRCFRFCFAFRSCGASGHPRSISPASKFEVVCGIRGTKFEERRETIEMRIQGKLSYLRLLVPLLLFAGVQAFALTAADSRMPVAGTASHQTTKPHADVLLISDQTLLMMKSIEGMAMNQGESATPGCSSGIVSVGAAKSLLGRCPIIDCAQPPPGCFYQGPPDRGPNGCPIDCGHLVCDGSGN